MKGMKSMKTKLLIITVTLLTSFEALALFGSRCKVDMQSTLDRALVNTQNVLTKNRKCSENFDSYFRNLITVAKGYPDPSNKQKFSDFLVSLSENGIITRQRAEELYNRYFSVKFLTMMGDYNVCSSVCSNEDSFKIQIENELADKETGLQKICRDGEAFARSNRLYAETLLVVSATCRTCAAANR
jgi:hypothetical protein